MEYIFNVIAILLTTTTWIYVYNIKDKKTAMLKLVYVGMSVIYISTQMNLYFKVCRRIPESLAQYKYILQGLCLAGFCASIFVFSIANKYITKVQTKEESSIKTFKMIRKELEECKVLITDDEVLKMVLTLSETARYMDPVCYGVENEEEQILNLTHKLKNNLPRENAQQICQQIDELLKLRKIRATKR